MPQGGKPKIWLIRFVIYFQLHYDCSPHKLTDDLRDTLVLDIQHGIVQIPWEYIALLPILGGPPSRDVTPEHDLGPAWHFVWVWSLRLGTTLSGLLQFAGPRTNRSRL